MDDMQSRIAARRAEMERQRRGGLDNPDADTRELFEALFEKGKVAADEAARREQAAADKEEARQAAATRGILDGIEGEARAAGATVHRDGDKLVLDDKPAMPKVDRAGMRKSKVAQMLNDAARRRWTPGENWVVVGSIAAAVPMLALAPVVGAGLFVFGIWRMSVINAVHRRALIAEYPDLFAADQ